MSAPPRRYDVVIAGGGPAGAVAALVLSRAGARVIVFERARFPRHKLCGDTVNPGTLALLRGLGVAHAAGDFAIHGMAITGDRGVRIEGRYPDGVTGRAILREQFDHALLSAAAAAGARVEEEVGVRGTSSTDGTIDGVYAARAGGADHVAAGIVIAADGRHSRVARGVGLGHHPRAPRRWAVGAYFADVPGVTSSGEMHVREDKYVGVAPLPSGLTNACVVTADRPAVRNPLALLRDTLESDAALRGRFRGTRMVTAPTVLGPLAVDCPRAGAAGLLLAGDAAGFIDPMTGDGLRFAIRGGELAALEALRALEHGVGEAHVRLGRARRLEFQSKWMFNRSVRGLSGWPVGVRLATVVARMWPACVEQAMVYAGDVPRSRARPANPEITPPLPLAAPPHPHERRGP